VDLPVCELMKYEELDMDQCTALVLGGGGSHGALQVGALRALIKAGYTPDLIVGTSIGAVNAVGMGLWGIDLDGIDALERAWDDVSGAQMLDPRVSPLILRLMVGRPSDRARKKIENYFTSIGIDHGMRFNMIPWGRIGLVSADLATGQAVIYGQNPTDLVLEGLLTSIAVPPWFAPFQKDGQMIMDGGAFSTLPIEPALRMGATEIIALDLDDDSLLPKENLTMTQYFEQYIFAASRRHIYLETALAETHGVPVRRIDFRGLATKPIWDFSEHKAWIRAGYEKASFQIEQWEQEEKSGSVPIANSYQQEPAWK